MEGGRTSGAVGPRPRACTGASESSAAGCCTPWQHLAAPGSVLAPNAPLPPLVAPPPLLPTPLRRPLLALRWRAGGRRCCRLRLGRRSSSSGAGRGGLCWRRGCWGLRGLCGARCWLRRPCRVMAPVRLLALHVACALKTIRTHVRPRASALRTSIHPSTHPASHGGLLRGLELRLCVRRKRQGARALAGAQTRAQRGHHAASGAFARLQAAAVCLVGTLHAEPDAHDARACLCQELARLRATVQRLNAAAWHEKRQWLVEREQLLAAAAAAAGPAGPACPRPTPAQHADAATIAGPACLDASTSCPSSPLSSPAAACVTPTAAATAIASAVTEGAATAHLRAGARGTAVATTRSRARTGLRLWRATHARTRPVPPTPPTPRPCAEVARLEAQLYMLHDECVALPKERYEALTAVHRQAAESEAQLLSARSEVEQIRRKYKMLSDEVGSAGCGRCSLLPNCRVRAHNVHPRAQVEWIKSEHVIVTTQVGWLHIALNAQGFASLAAALTQVVQGLA